MSILRKLYDWTMQWARDPRAEWALFAIAFAESSFFPVPPDVLLIAMAVAFPTRAFRYAAITAVGAVIGGIAGYAIGTFVFGTIGAPIVAFYHAEGLVRAIGLKYESYAFLTVFTAAFTPIPYKVITIAAGFFKISFFPFVIASVIGRSLRFFLVAGLIYRYGARMTAFIEKYFNILSFVFAALLMGGYLLITYVL